MIYSTQVYLTQPDRTLPELALPDPSLPYPIIPDTILRRSALQCSPLPGPALPDPTLTNPSPPTPYPAGFYRRIQSLLHAPRPDPTSLCRTRLYPTKPCSQTLFTYTIYIMLARRVRIGRSGSRHFARGCKILAMALQDPRKVFVGNVPVGVDLSCLGDVLGSG